MVAFDGAIFLQHQWRNLDHFPWYKDDVDILQFEEATSATSLENLALWASDLVVFRRETPVNLAHMGLHQQIPRNG